MKLTYFINQYPKVSHSFIRREILALEGLGCDVTRFSIRKTPLADLADTRDIEEWHKTQTLMGGNVTRLLIAVLRVSCGTPILFPKILFKATALGWRSQRGILRHWAYLAEACLLKAMLSRECVSHVHAHFGTNSTTVVMLCKLLGGPEYSFTVHGPEEFDDPIGLALKEKIMNCCFVVAVSHYGQSQLMRQCPHHLWDKIKVVHCAVDEGFRNVQNDNFPAKPRLICVGRLCEQKGQLLLLEALHLLHTEGIDFEMVLAGDGEMRSVIEQDIRKFRLEEKVTITGWLSGDQVKKEILASRAMVLPSFAEGLPVVIMEAFALQRPVLATFVAGIPELVEHGKNGWLIPAGSIEALVAAIKLVLTTPTEELLNMGREGAKRIEHDFNDMTEAKYLEQLFRQCGLSKHRVR